MNNQKNDKSAVQKKHQQSEQELIQDYLSKLNFGQEPDRKGYIDKYMGKDKEVFVKRLDFAITLEKAFKNERKKIDARLTGEDIKRAEKLVKDNLTKHISKS